MSSNVCVDHGAPLPGTPLDEQVLYRRLVFQLLAFVCLEFLFITLAISCLNSPLPISANLSLSPTLTKAGFSVVFIAWQTIATIYAGDAVLHGFSSEWYFRFRETRRLIPGHTDLVSTITSGFFDRFYHFFSHTSSPTYRLSFIAYWVLAALLGLGPGVINVADIPRFTPTKINVTNLTHASNNVESAILRSWLITELELQENTSFKFATQDHVIVGWPSIEVGKLTQDIEFESDILLYNMSCWWEAPTSNMSQWNTTWYAGGFAWYPWNTPPHSTTFEGGLMPMYRFSTHADSTADDYPNRLGATDPIGLSGYIFYGRNSSLPRATGRRYFNLDGLPTTFDPSGFQFINFDGDEAQFESTLATFLLCDPQARILDGRVLLSQSNSSLTLLSTSLPLNNVPKVGNITPRAADAALALSLVRALGANSETASMKIGDFAARAFLNDTSLNFDKTPEKPFDVGILPVENIQRTLNSFVNLGAQGFASYDRDYDGDVPEKTFVTSVDASLRESRLALTTSRGLLISMISLFSITMIMLVLNIFYYHFWQMLPFKLESVLLIADKGGIEHEPVYKEEHREPQSSSHLNISMLVVHLLGFVVTEGVFFSLVLTCSRSPILVNIPFSSAEVTGGFTVIFVLWQTLAVFLLSDAVSFAFSIEWSLQHAKTRLLVPGVTDCVSCLTSGGTDRLRYFVTRKPSITFRFAFLTWLALTMLKFFAPGTLSLSQVKTAVELPIRIADLRYLNSSQTGHNQDYLMFLGKKRAYFFALIDRHEGSIFKYTMEPHWMMPWPDERSIGSEVIGNVEYATDVVRFDYSCEWRVPEMGTSEGATVWIIDGQTWEFWNKPNPKTQYVGGIVPLYRRTDTQPDTRSAFLVIGSNETFPVDPKKDRRPAINLDNLPTLFHPSGLSLNSSNSLSSRWISPLSTILLCDPRVEVSGGRAQLTQNKNLMVTASGLPPVNNIPHETITTLFTQAFLSPLDTGDVTGNRWLGRMSRQVFLASNSTSSSKFPHGIPIHDLDTIEGNLNGFMSSVSKAYLDGFYVNPSINISDMVLRTTPVVALAEVHKQALVGDETLGILSLWLSSGVVVCFSVLIRLLLSNVGAAFELGHLLKAVNDGPVERSQMQ